ncbi:MAG TPA: LuxR C-terminal-related transcriptional regulator [Candidatus Baltobacteraceae bacterium]|jgi:LuxR family maltose regulon positive regulatory protein|nr:LuxR C-terminal-related transcriptional regulator [Candidatus Baltobacteraceae bacterium]
MRARVNERLERAARFPVTLIVAPAGFGKSVALRDFLETSRTQAARYDVRREDGTLLAFVRRLSETLQPYAPSALAAFPAMQERVLAADEPVLQLSDWFLEHLKQCTCTVVIDDLHYAAPDPASIALLADLVERTSERMKWIISTRSDVGLPIATWVAYGRMDIPIGEDDLRFTSDEALATADQTQTAAEPSEIEELRQLTEGWPVALTIALRTRTHSTDLQKASFGTREMVYRYLAEQVFAGLTPQQREFALATSVFSTFDGAIAQSLGGDQRFVESFRSKAAFLNETGPAQYRYHDLFRDFLETELRRSGEERWRLALSEGARLLEERGDYAGALVLYVKARAAPQLLQLIERDGFSLFERGEAGKLADALDILPLPLRSSSAVAVGLRAMIDAGLGRFEIAQRDFLNAIAQTERDDELRMRLVHRYAIELVRSDHDCVQFLEPYALDERIDARYRVPLFGTLATGYLHAGKSAEALSVAQRGLAALDASISADITARLFQQAAYVERYAGSKEKARSYANTAIELALANNLHELAARAYSVLYTIVHDTTDDPIASLAILDKLSECARKGASSQARLFALVASYDIEVERGDDAALEDLDRQMQEYQALLPRLRTTAVLPAQALRAAWSGDFDGAYERVGGTAADQTTAEQRALRAAESGLYALAAGRNEEGERELQAASDAVTRADACAKDVIRARLLLAVAEMVRGHDGAAHRYISEAERVAGGSLPRLAALANAVRTMYRVRLGQTEPEHWAAALERLRSNHFGGLARLLGALPQPAAEGGGYTALTPAEREILQMLARGASTKEVAGSTGRSPHTVDTHIRSICRKLECRGRREAIALATSRGWVQT